MKKCMWFDEDSIDIYNKLVNDPVNFKKVIKEFAPDETLDMIAKVWEIAGIMVDEKR